MFPSFPKIERVENIYCEITEKIDGTNGLIELNWIGLDRIDIKYGSRNRYIIIGSDNHGFVSFFSNHKNKLEDLFNHPDNSSNKMVIYGEWFGTGIQKNRNNMDGKYFMPFSNFLAEKMIEVNIPNIIKPVTLYKGKFSTSVLDEVMNKLKENGSNIGECNNPEGVVIYFKDHNFRLKETFDKPKWVDKMKKKVDKSD